MRKLAFSIILVITLFITMNPQNVDSSSELTQKPGQEFHEKLLTEWGILDHTLLFSNNLKSNPSYDIANNIVLICESDFNLNILNPEINGYCNDTNIITTDNKMLITIQSPDWYNEVTQILITQSEEGYQQIVIPKTFITTPGLREGILLHFTSLNKTAEEIIDLTTKEQRYSPYTSLIELVKYSLSTFIILGIIYTIISSWTWAKKSEFNTIYGALLDKHTNIRSFILKLLITFIFLLPLFIIISIIYIISTPGFIAGSNYSLSVKLLYLLSNKQFMALSVTYSIIVIFLLLLLFFDVITKRIIKIIVKLKRVRVNQIELKYLIYILIISLNIFIWIFPNKVGVIISLSILVFLFPIIWLAIFSKDLLFKVHEIILLSIILLIISLLGSKFYINSQNNTPYPTDLFESQEILTLPHTIMFDSKIKFTSAVKQSNFPIFANEFLVYHPEHEQLINNSFNESISKNSNFMVIEDKYKFLKEITSSSKSATKNANILKSNPSSPYFRFHNPVNVEKDLYFEVTIECINAKPYDILIERYDQRRIGIGKLLSIDGCTESEKNKTYIVRVDPGLFKKDTLYKLGASLENTSILDYKYISDNKEIPINKYDLLETYDSDFGEYLYLAPSNRNEADFKVISDGYSEDYSFSLNGSLFDNINKLIQEELLTDTIILWTPAENAILYESEKGNTK